MVLFLFGDIIKCSDYFQVIAVIQSMVSYSIQYLVNLNRHRLGKFDTSLLKFLVSNTQLLAVRWQRISCEKKLFPHPHVTWTLEILVLIISPVSSLTSSTSDSDVTIGNMLVPCGIPTHKFSHQQSHLVYQLLPSHGKDHNHCHQASLSLVTRHNLLQNRKQW